MHGLQHGHVRLRACLVCCAPSSMWVSMLRLPSCEGKEPLTRVSLRCSRVSRVSCASCVGSVPATSVRARSRMRSDVSEANCLGKSPRRLESSSSKTASRDSWPISLGMVPVSVWLWSRRLRRVRPLS